MLKGRIFFNTDDYLATIVVSKKKNLPPKKLKKGRKKCCVLTIVKHVFLFLRMEKAFH